MSRYFVQANYIGDAEPPYHGMMPDIHVSDHRPIDTGLVDHRGARIMRAPEPVGFHKAFKHANILRRS